jgi:predicted secreted acid phosphatase
MLSSRRLVTGLVTGFSLLLVPVVAGAAPQVQDAKVAASARVVPGTTTGRLAPRTHFTMKPDGSSGRTQGGDGIPNIDSVKKTIAVYYGDTGKGTAAKDDSPYIDELARIVTAQRRSLKARYAKAIKRHEKPALVFDTDDTTLFTYDMEVADMHFNFDPAEQDVWVQDQRFPATPLMVDYVNTARELGYTIFGLTGRNDDQKQATLANLRKVGYRGFTSKNFYTKWVSGGRAKPGYLSCATTSCTTVEYKAGTRKHIEQDRGFDIVANFGDQWSDLQGGYADRVVKLPNPTYYLPSPDLPGVREPELSPRTRFTMRPDGSSGLTVSGEGIPNIDSVKKTIAVYYGDTGKGTADKDHSPYIQELQRIIRTQRASLQRRYDRAIRAGEQPALVFDADDTTLFTYDMEVADMHFNFSPAEQDVWVQDQRFPATPLMVDYVNTAADIGYTVFGLTGRNDDQKQATLANLEKVGYEPFTSNRFFTKWTGSASSQQPSYVDCGSDAKCSTVEYKSQTRKHIEQLGYTVVTNYGDQYSDLLGGYADRTVKLPNPTYYLP